MGDSKNSNDKQLLVIDTDAGLDDAQAIVMALGNPDVNVVAITTVQGNTSVKQISKNVLRLLRLCNRQSIPVYQGCESSMIGAREDSSYYHGNDGFGDIPDLAEHENGNIEEEHAVQALIRLAKKHPGMTPPLEFVYPRKEPQKTHEGKISLVCLGPLTNIAMAVRLCPEFGSKLKDCFIMGGNYQGVGNTTLSAEFNFHSDPEAAHIVLSELNCPSPLQLTCWELSLDFQITWEQYEKWLPESRTLSRFFKQAEMNSVKFLRENGYLYLVCDQLAMAACLDQSAFVTESTHVIAHVELSGTKTRGQMVVDWRPKDPPNVTLIKKFDMDKLFKMFLKSLEVVDS